MFAILLCVAHLLPTELQVASRLSRPKTRLEWTRSTYPSWLSWGRLPSPHLEVDTPAPRGEPLGRQAPTITSHHRFVVDTHEFMLLFVQKRLSD